MQRKRVSKNLSPIAALVIVIIIISSAGLYVIAFPAEEVVYSFNDDTMEAFPTHYRVPLQIAQPSLLHLRCDLISYDGEDDFISFTWELYECDLQTFDNNYQFEDIDAMWEFRRDYYRMSGGVHQMSYDGFLVDDTLEGNHVFVWWLNSQAEYSNWEFSISISLRVA